VETSVVLVEYEPVCTFQLALARVAKARILYTRRDLPTALALLNDSKRVFERLGEHKAFIQASTLEGAIHYAQPDYVRAAKVFFEIYDACVEMEDRELQARNANNLGQVLAKIGDYDLADQYLSTAVQLFLELEMYGEVTLAQWGKGRVAARRDRYADALSEFQSVRAALRTDGRFLQVALATLDIADALVALQQPDAASAECSGLAEIFFRAGLAENARAALDYLHGTSPVQRERIGHVRSFLADVEEKPALAFTPPAA
jgi:tetratricopeptide (TPR) repeat protein